MGTALILGLVGGALFFITGRGIAKLFKMTPKDDTKESAQGLPWRERTLFQKIGTIILVGVTILICVFCLIVPFLNK